MYCFNDEKYFIKPKKKFPIIYVSSIIRNEIHDYYDYLNLENYNICRGNDFKNLFFKNLEKKIKSKIMYKLPREIKKKLGTISIPKKIFSIINKEQILPNKISLRKFREQSEILIIDSIYTTYLEALIKNIPFIIIAPKNLFLFNKNIKFIKPLIDAGIIFFDANKAANFINKFYGNYNVWWNKKKFRMLEKTFRH